MAFVLISLTAATFDSGWFSLSSQAGAASAKDVAHGLGAVPSTVTPEGSAYRALTKVATQV